MKVNVKNKYSRGHYLHNKNEVVVDTPTKKWTRQDIWNLGAPERCIVRSREELDNKLLEALKSPLIKMEDSFLFKKFQELKREGLMAA